MAMQASSEQQRALLDVQSLDTQLLQLEHKSVNLPERVLLKDLEVELGQIEYRIVAVKTEIADLSLEVSKAEADVEQVRNRAKKDQERLDSGAVNAVKELESLQHELVSLGKRQADLEEIEIEILQKAEDAQRALDELEGQRADVMARLEQVRQDLSTIETDLGATREAALSQRATVSAHIPSDLFALYNKIREDLGGVGAALLQRGACQGCHLSIDASELDRIRSLPEDAVVRCEECRRILVRTQESGL